MFRPPHVSYENYKSILYSGLWQRGECGQLQFTCHFLHHFPHENHHSPHKTVISLLQAVRPQTMLSSSAARNNVWPLRERIKWYHARSQAQYAKRSFRYSTQLQPTRRRTPRVRCDTAAAVQVRANVQHVQFVPKIRWHCAHARGQNALHDHCLMNNAIYFVRLHPRPSLSDIAPSTTLCSLLLAISRVHSISSQSAAQWPTSMFQQASRRAVNPACRCRRFHSHTPTCHCLLISR